MAGKYKGNNTNRRNSKPNRQLSTTIGDLLSSKGEDFPPIKYKYPNYKKSNNKVLNNKPEKTGLDKLKEEGIDLSKVPVHFDMSEKPIEEVVADENKTSENVEGNWEELTKLFTESEEDRIAREQEEKSNSNVFHINSEYITKDGTDKRVKTSEFITNK